MIKKGERMLGEYRSKVKGILLTTQITGYDFQFVTEISQFDVESLDDLMSLYQQERFRKEKRWKDNPKRRGFMGIFMFWIPKKISYEVNVKDGENIRIYELLSDITTDFTNQTRNNIISIFQQAREQIDNYKNVFNKNFDALNDAMQKTLEHIKLAASTKNSIQKKMEDTKQKAEEIHQVMIALTRILDQ